MLHPQAGQRYISTSEPALGLGHVISTENGLIEIAFPSVEEVRTYAIDGAPLVRVRFSPGDCIADQAGHEFIVHKVKEIDGHLTYYGEQHEVSEEELADNLQFIRPDKKLLAGLTDHPRDFDHRLKALRWNSRVKKNPARGYVGARIDLIPHQLAIVSECATRLHPRVLLADEVGLGKTIEACLIMHRLHLTGRANRVLIVVPEALVHQWFVELLRRFNLLFALFDEARCRSITANDETQNPFLDSQLILCSVAFLTENENRAAQAREAGFDLLIVDEAHHLEWSPENKSVEYATIEQLAATIKSLLLLTATPQQLGPEGHFARLRLLDPARYTNLELFRKETEQFAPLATLIDQLADGKTPKTLGKFGSEITNKQLTALQDGDESMRHTLISHLVDTVGTGRVFFRNTREQLEGFPVRVPHLHPLPKGASPYLWLSDLLKSLDAGEKVLLITSSVDAAITIQEKLLQIINIESTVFHEELSMLERDRNAAYFQEEEGAQLLISSEIGSEGRNFQVAKHLVLFGLPQNPEVLEQRIGRLDRIGQTGNIHIHIPYGENSKSELQARWLHEGVDAFSKPLKGASTLAAELLPRLLEIEEPGAEFDQLLLDSKTLKAKIGDQLATGHDRLIELGGPRAEQATVLQEQIKEADGDLDFSKFCLRLFDRQGIDIADLSERSYLLKKGQRSSDAFADLSEDGLSITFDRNTALSREDYGFLSIDHPLFLDALEQLLSGNQGNASFATLATGKRGVLLDCAFVLEAKGPKRLELESFLAPTLLRVIVDHEGTPQTKAPSAKLLKPGDVRRIVSQEAFKTGLFPKLLKAAETVAQRACAKPITASVEIAKVSKQQRIDRLKALTEQNGESNEEEITLLEAQAKEVTNLLSSAKLRLDAVRLIYCS